MKNVILFLFEAVRHFFLKDAVLSPQQLKRLSEHKYSAQDKSILDELFMHKFWSWLVLKYPLWLAPNVITLFGLLLNVTATVILSYYSPDAKQDAPRWTYFLCAVTLFAYQSLDATDGKQARRTNSSSPLGELFDHGCDSLSQVFVSLQICLAVRLGENPSFVVYVFILAVTLFYCAHWQTYVSGTLRFGRFDVTEAQFIIIFVCLTSTVYGAQIWATPVFGIPFKFYIVFLSTVIAAISMWSYMTVIFTGGAGKYGSTIADTSIIYPVLPLATFVIPPVVIFWKAHTDVFTDHIVLYCIVFGLVSAKITNKIIVAHMSRSAFNAWDTIMWSPIALAGNQYFDHVVPEYPLLYACLVYGLVNLLCYCWMTCQQICDNFNIECFRIPYPQQQPAPAPILNPKMAAVDANVLNRPALPNRPN